VPAPIPLTVPTLLMVATAVLLLVQLPPATLSDTVVVAPLQIAVVPVMADAVRSTVIVAVALPVPHVPVIV